MTTEQINKAIAEACGWTGITLRVHGIGGPRLAGFHKEAGVHKFLPNYCGDLNAMWEAEAHLTPEQQDDFAYYLSEIVAPITGESWKSIHASAMSRAKAFLRTFGKWEEAQ